MLQGERRNQVDGALLLLLNQTGSLFLPLLSILGTEGAPMAYTMYPLPGQHNRVALSLRFSNVPVITVISRTVAYSQSKGEMIGPDVELIDLLGHGKYFKKPNIMGGKPASGLPGEQRPAAPCRLLAAMSGRSSLIRVSHGTK